MSTTLENQACAESLKCFTVDGCVKSGWLNRVVDSVWLKTVIGRYTVYKVKRYSVEMSCYSNTYRITSFCKCALVF